MTVEFWTGAERFYEFWFVVLTVLLLNIVILLIFGATYTSQKNKKRFFVLIIGLTVFLGSAGIIGHARYHPYLEQASYTNALIRDREPRWTGYIYYGSREQTIYSELNDLESLRQLDLYTEEQVTEPAHYLGKGKYFYYFENLEGEKFKYFRLSN